MRFARSGSVSNISVDGGGGPHYAVCDVRMERAGDLEARATSGLLLGDVEQGVAVDGRLSDRDVDDGRRGGERNRRGEGGEGDGVDHGECGGTSVCRCV